MSIPAPEWRVNILTSHQQTETEFLNLVDMVDSTCATPLQVRELVVRVLGRELVSAFQGHIICGRPTTIPQAVHFNVSVRLLERMVSK